VALLGEWGREKRTVRNNSDHQDTDSEGLTFMFGLWKEDHSEPRSDGKIASPGTKGKKQM